jgi:hypothetical protein
MSKAQLTKELKNLDREQLQQLILDVYDARKEAREYFDFFLHPDVDKLFAKYDAELIKECERNRRGYSKARISRIRNTLKLFDTFEPGADYVIRLMLNALRYCIAAQRCFRCTDAFTNGICKLAVDVLKRADANLTFDKTFAQLNNLINSAAISPSLRRQIIDSIGTPL